MRAIEGRVGKRIAVSDFVHALDEIAGLLKFNREKVSCRDIDALQINAGLISSAGSYLVGPEVPAALVRLAIEKVVLVLADIVPRIVNRVG